MLVITTSIKISGVTTDRQQTHMLAVQAKDDYAIST